MATPKIIADFEAQLSTALSVGDTSFTLSSATDDDGVALPAGLYYFTLDNGNSNKEYLAGTLSGTSVTGVLSVSRQGVETSGCARAHRVGASVIITDWKTYKKYMDEIALVSAPDADTSTKGVMEAATLAEVRARTASGSTGANLAVTPDVLDDLPTSDEKAALAGNAGTPSATNKFITEDGLTVTDVFLTSGTWTKPTGASWMEVIAIGSGGGGGGGCGTTSGKGGGGGGAGAYVRVRVDAADAGATETVTVGSGGAGGAGSATDTSTAGTAGTDTTFGSLVTAVGGAGGLAPVAAAAPGAVAARDAVMEAMYLVGSTSSVGMGGGTGTADGQDAVSGLSVLPTGGGQGGGNNSLTAYDGGAGGSISGAITLAGGTAGSVSVGGAGTSVRANSPQGGTGGGGGGAVANSVNPGYAGGAGGNYGGGGGGGGSSEVGTGGTGGAGGAGICVVITHFQ